MQTVIPDQAAGLRRMFARQALARSVAFVSGTPGIGRSSLVGDLAVALARRGQSVCVVECGHPQRGAASHFGWRLNHDLADVIRTDRPLDEVVCTGPEGVRFVAVRGVVRMLGRLGERDESRLTGAFSALDPQVDMLLVDAPGDAETELGSCVAAASENVLVVSAGRDGITDAYGLVKRLQRETGRRRFHAVITRAKGEDHARTIHDNLAETARRFLSANVAWLGWVPDDADRMKALRLHQPVSCAFPMSPSAHAIGGLADTLLHWPYAAEEGLDGFVHRLVQASRTLLSENA